jgi:hypothetical protein
MPRKRRPFTPLAPFTLAPLALHPQIKLNLTNIAFISSANTLKPSSIPSKSLTLISTLTPCPKIDMLKSKKAKSKKLEIELTLTLTLTPPVKIVSCNIEFRIYLNKVKRIMQAFFINLLIRVRKTG